MNLQEIAVAKAELLCYGVRLDETAKAETIYENSYLLDGGFVHAAHFLIDGIVINTCVAEKFCHTSPYVIALEKGKTVLRKNGQNLCDIRILPLPKWCNATVDGKTIGDYFRPHAPNCISGCPKLVCSFYAEGVECKFCSLGAYASKIGDRLLSPEVAAEMIEVALKNNRNYEVALSGGTCHSEDRSALYFAKICRAITSNRNRDVEISVELAPPDKNEYLQELYDAGASSIIMNIEVADENKRREICPGKVIIPIERYFDALKKAVEIFGRGKVSSVLIAGTSIQPSEDILAICKKLIPMGVIPTIIPFKPLDDCLLKDCKIAEPEEILWIAEEVNKLLIEENLKACEQSGCTKCGGCSLESVFQLIASRQQKVGSL
jgi:radical SAM protein (TIGR04043 family)